MLGSVGDFGCACFHPTALATGMGLTQHSVQFRDRRQKTGEAPTTRVHDCLATRFDAECLFVHVS